MKKNKRELLAGYVDGELPDKQRKELEEELKNNAELRAELEEFMSLKEITGIVKYADLPDEVWENYWQNLYRKLERGVGWIFMSFGAIVLICYGMFELFKGLYTDPEVPLLVSISASVLTIGAVILLVSFVRERIFAYNRERYSEVQK